MVMYIMSKIELITQIVRAHIFKTFKSKNSDHLLLSLVQFIELSISSIGVLMSAERIILAYLLWSTWRCACMISCRTIGPNTAGIIKMRNNKSICVVSHMSPQQTWGQRSSRGQWPLVQFLVWGQIWYYNDCKRMWSRKQARLVVSRTALFLVPFKCWQHCWITLENQTPIQLSNWIKSQHFQIFSSKKNGKEELSKKWQVHSETIFCFDYDLSYKGEEKLP